MEQFAYTGQTSVKYAICCIAVIFSLLLTFCTSAIFFGPCAFVIPGFCIPAVCNVGRAFTNKKRYQMNKKNIHKTNHKLQHISRVDKLFHIRCVVESLKLFCSFCVANY